MSADWDWASPSGLVVAKDNTFRFAISTTDEGKLALKELKLLKKQFGLEKREIDAQIRAIRTEYSQSTKRRGSPLRGGGSLGKFVRTVDRLDRDSKRSQYANALDPFLERRDRIDRRIAELDQAALQLEAHLLSAERQAAPNTSPQPPASAVIASHGKNFCNRCGAPRDANMRFCGQCGASLG